MRTPSPAPARSFLVDRACAVDERAAWLLEAAFVGDDDEAVLLREGDLVGLESGSAEQRSVAAHATCSTELAGRVDHVATLARQANRLEVAEHGLGNSCNDRFDGRS